MQFETDIGIVNQPLWRVSVCEGKDSMRAALRVQRNLAYRQ